jgi:hypothetical protein
MSCCGVFNAGKWKLDIIDPNFIIQCVPKAMMGFQINVYKYIERNNIHRWTWIKLKNSSNSFFDKFTKVLRWIHRWLCKHLSGIPFPHTLDLEHQQLQMQRLLWFAVSSVEVNLRLTVSRPVCLGVRRPVGTRDQFFFLLEISFRQLLVCYFVAPSLTRWRVCNLL